VLEGPGGVPVRAGDGARFAEAAVPAGEHDSPKLLFRQACEYLSSSRLVRPGVVNILERVATARDRARDETWERLAPALTGHRRAELDRLPEVDPVLGRTRLSWLGGRARRGDPGGGEDRAGEAGLPARDGR
jgi:hypothetical protein